MEKQANPNPNSPNSQPMDSPTPSPPSSKPDPPSPETLAAGSDKPPEDPKPDKEGGAAEEEEEEEEAECGFCLFMKGGGCKDEFVAWEKCVEEAEKNEEDIAEKCFDITHKLKLCMDAHADYYAPILDAEKSMAKAVSEAEAEDSDSGSGAPVVESEKSASDPSSVPVSAP